MADAPKKQDEVHTCECCGRDFTVPAGDYPVDEDGVTFCPRCKPNY